MADSLQSMEYQNLAEKTKTEMEDVGWEDSPIEQVRLTVPNTDDPTVPALTFRTWTLGIISCVVLAFLNQFFYYRENQLSIASLAAQIIVLPAGRFMSKKLPKKLIRVPGTSWEFSLNPGPFSMKEHVLITIFANSGASSVYAVGIVTIVRVFYHRKINPIAGFLLIHTTQLLGYGWAGIFRKFLVDSPYMWWPTNLIQVTLFRTLNEKETRPSRGTTRLQFFFMFAVCSFAWFIVPQYFFPVLSAFSVVCYIWKDSILAQQLGSGVKGLGLGAFSLDWSSFVSFLGTPLATPGFAIINVMAGFIFFLYVLVPIAYWSNSYHAKRFPLFSSRVFRGDGSRYDPSAILNPNTFEFDPVGYKEMGPIHLSSLFALAYGLNFATLTATITHVALFHGRSIWRQTKASINTQALDIHTRLMRKNYKSVPEWWFSVILVSVIALAFVTCLGFGGQMQLPWWGILLACAVSFMFTLPIGIITSTTNQQPGLNVITELIIGYLYPGRPLANVAFKTYGYISMTQAISFLSDFKLGHYMKIPPRSMFSVQLVGTLIASTVYYGTSWWLLSSVPNICDEDKNPNWSCPNDGVFYSASIIWGVVGPSRMFAPYGVYAKQNWWFLVGLVAPLPVWALSRAFPHKKWIKLINVPIFLGATGMMPPAGAIHYWCWGFIGILFNVIIYRKFKGWWARHTYVLSAALDSGVAFSGVALFFALQNWNVAVDWWGATNPARECPLAICPTEPGFPCPS